MKAIILHELLSRGLNNVSRVVATKGQLPVLANVLISADSSGVTLSVTNLELGMKIKIGGKVLSEGSLTIPARNLAEFVSTLRGENVELETNEDKLVVKCNKSIGTFAGISASEFPVMPQLSEGDSKKKTELKRELVMSVANEVSFAAAAEESRPVLTGMLFKSDNSILKVTATDGFRLSRKEFDLARPLPLLEKGIILPSRALQELSRIVSEGRTSTVEMEVVEENNQVIFGYEVEGNGQVQLISRVLEGNFPPVDSIVPGDFKTESHFDREDFLAAVRAASIFARDSNNVVRLKVEKSNVKVVAAAQQTGESEIEIEAETTGEEGEIAFNYKYITDYLGSVSCERVVLKMNGSLAPGVFVPETSEKLTHLIMPVRI